MEKTTDILSIGLDRLDKERALEDARLRHEQGICSPVLS